MAKVMVSLPDDLLSEIDAAARRRSTTRSGFLADAVRKELARRDSNSMRAAVERIEALASKYGWPTHEDLMADKVERDQRDMRR